MVKIGDCLKKNLFIKNILENVEKNKKFIFPVRTISFATFLDEPKLSVCSIITVLSNKYVD